jgi:hypothetical protein
MSAMSALPLRDDAVEPELLHWSAFGPSSDDFKVKLRFSVVQLAGCLADFLVTVLLVLFCFTHIHSTFRSLQMLQPTLGILWLQFGTLCQISIDLADGTARRKFLFASASEFS